MPGDAQGRACPVRPLSRTTPAHRAAVALLVLIVTLLALVAPANAEQRIALVVTNQAYTQAGAALTNTHRDGDLVRAALERVGFKVTVVRDTANEAALLTAFGDHVQRLAEAGPDAVGFVYYSGHGAADRPDGANYLIPTGAPITHAAQLPLMAVRLDKITETLARVGRINFVVFDACRNVPLQRAEKDGSFKGWAPVKEQSGLLVAYATEPGNVAVDQSIYARALAEEIVQPGREASSAFRAVARRVIQETGNRQAPQYLDRRLHDFEFAALAGSPEVQPRRQEQATTDAVNRPPTAGPGSSRPPSSHAPPVCDGTQVALASGAIQCMKPGSGQSFRDCPSCPEMIVAPAGSFMMGSSADDPRGYADERPQHRVTFTSPFAAGKAAVSFAEWDECVAEGGCNGYAPQDSGWGRGKRPVIFVSFGDAEAYVAWLSKRADRRYRLLTEAEREYITRAGTSTNFWWGNDITTDRANYNGHFALPGGSKGVARAMTVPVDSFKPNPWGFMQVHGNIWEWTEDCWQSGYQGAPADGSARVIASECKERSIRGGSWDLAPAVARSAFRGKLNPMLRTFSLGFRVARVVE